MLAVAGNFFFKTLKELREFANVILNSHNSLINNKLILSDIQCMTLTILPDFAVFLQ